MAVGIELKCSRTQNHRILSASSADKKPDSYCALRALSGNCFSPGNGWPLVWASRAATKDSNPRFQARAFSFPQLLTSETPDGIVPVPLPAVQLTWKAQFNHGPAATGASTAGAHG
jgi:hypothetical protein